MKFRLLSVLSGFFLIFGALIFKLYDLQINKGTFYSARAESQFRLAGLLAPRRGTIYLTDRNGNLIPVALNRDYPVVFAVPNQIEDMDEATEGISAILSLDPDEVRKKLSKINDTYELLAVKISEEQADAVRSAKIKGVYVDAQEFRYYPFGNLAAHVLGYVGPSSRDAEVKGRYGVEAYFDEALSGIPGATKGEKIIAPTNGKDIVLTIDRNIQAQAEDILQKTIENNKAVGGTVIVQEPKTGKILALANSPSFDPSVYSKSEVGNFLNPALQSVYESGSVFKVITMSAGIDTGKIATGTVFTDTGSLTLNGKTIRNHDGGVYGKVTMTEVIEKSINTGAAFAERKTGHDNFYNYVVRFGFDEKTGVSLPGEVKGSLKSLKVDAREINFATASFGQGIAVTPIELMGAISAIANGGLLMKPHIEAEEASQAVRRVIKPDTAREVTAMMASTVKKAVIAQIPNYLIAGKTGTAQIPNFKQGGYTDEFIHTFAGFAPASDPKFAILFKIDKPKVGPLAGFTVVPAFRELAQFILNYYNIPPDDLAPGQ